MNSLSRTVDQYRYTDFREELVRTDTRHPHVIRREPETTYRDEFALSEFMNIAPGLYQEFLRGWSRSYYTSAKHLEAILAYGTPDIPTTSINEALYTQCVIDVENGLRSLPRVRAFDVLSEMDRVSFKSSTAAGYDYQGEKGPKGGENHHRAISRAKAIMWSINEDGITALEHAIKTAVPDVGYTRTQLADLTEKTKIRGVWGRAFHYILLEGLFADPLLRMFSRHDSFYHIGTDPKISVPKLMSDISHICKWKYALDWKQFDATVSRFEIYAAFEILKQILTFPNPETEIVFYLCRELFIHKKIAAPDGWIYEAHKGIPSGSYFTSIVGSIINRLRIQYLWRVIIGRGPKKCFTQGDDSLSGDNTLIRPEEFKAVADSVGWYFNADKTEYSTVTELISFLGRTSKGSMNHRSLMKCIRLLIYPEYPVETGRISAYRAASIHDDSGRLSDILRKISVRLKRKYGKAHESEVPAYFKVYIPGL